MNKKILNPLNLILAIGVIQIISLIFLLPAVNMISKILIMPSIAFYLVTSYKNLGIKLSLMLLSALLFSWFGDIALMIPSSDSVFFLAGVGFFLVAQVSYFFLFIRLVNQVPVKGLPLWYWVSYPVVVIYAVILWLKLYPGLGDLSLPVAIYTLALTSMVCASLYRYRRTAYDSFTWLFTGAILFMMSDSMIAIHKFLLTTWNERIWVMTTYILAQLFIAKGIVLHHRKG
jgi:uncharacterized membrane protein YhhN